MVGSVAVDGRDLAACTWTPGAGFALPDGTVDPVFLWAALDCPSFFGMHVPYDKVFLLAEMSASLRAAIPADRLAVAESGIRDRSDVERLAAAGFDAFLVGETLMRAVAEDTDHG